MNLIAIDLEWNTATRSSKIDPELAAKMMFEIIEVGAVRMDKDLDVVERFQRHVLPVLYKRIQWHIAAVTNRTQQSLYHGDPFDQVAQDLKKFIGDNAVLASWGTSDSDVLLSNIRFHPTAPDLAFRAINIQAIFSGLAEGTTRGNQRSIEYALDFFRLDKDLPFHEAISDATYAARILAETLRLRIAECPNETIDSLLRPYLYNPFLNSQCEERMELSSEEDILETLESRSYACPACGKTITGDWTVIKADKSWFAKAACPDHGDIEILAKRMRRTKIPRLHIRTRIPQGPMIVPEPALDETPLVWLDPEA
ncbi:MAG TPA: 3'-5' exonuclease [Clostridia bacterium]|nr:3'-5' exonuclease [Clostridia bacterium]